MRPSLDDLQFDARHYRFLGEPRPREARVWQTARPDVIELHVFHLEPDLPRVRQQAEMTRWYRDMVEQQGCQLVECQTTTVDGLAALQVVLFAPRVEQRPPAFIASLTVPFVDCSFVLKTQAMDMPMSGFRESVLCARKMEEGWRPPTAERWAWIDQPWSPWQRDQDADFRDSPLTRARTTLEELRSSAKLARALHNHRGFPLPGTS